MKVKFNSQLHHSKPIVRNKTPFYSFHKKTKKNKIYKNKTIKY
jgi:hypothetical protein